MSWTANGSAGLAALVGASVALFMKVASFVDCTHEEDKAEKKSEAAGQQEMECRVLRWGDVEHVAVIVHRHRASGCRNPW